MSENKRELVRQVRQAAMLAAGPAGLHEIETSGLNWMQIRLALEYQDIRISELEANNALLLALVQRPHHATGCNKWSYDSGGSHLNPTKKCDCGHEDALDAARKGGAIK